VRIFPTGSDPAEIPLFRGLHGILLRAVLPCGFHDQFVGDEGDEFSISFGVILLLAQQSSQRKGFLPWMEDTIH